MEVVLAHGRALASTLIEPLAREGARAEVAGAVRRAEELVRELVLVVDRAPSEVERLLDIDELALEHVPGGLRGDWSLPHGAVPVRIRCTTPRGFVEALVRETGSEAHVAILDARAEGRLAEIAAHCSEERALYAALDVPFVSPELRDGGPVPPDLVERVRGVFHVHTSWSDGVASVARMVRAAAAAGFEYVGISDHSRAASYARGLDPERLAAQREAITHARAELPHVTILHGVECDILEDGTLDLPDDCLEQLDFVIASVHSDLALDRAAQTRRVVRALSHPLVTALGHPTGRLLLGRAGIDLDLDEVARAAAAHGAGLEINTTAQRLDLDAAQARRAASWGASFFINPDAHEPEGFTLVQDGVRLARRARLTGDRIVNTRSANDMRAYLQARKARARARA